MALGEFLTVVQATCGNNNCNCPGASKVKEALAKLSLDDKPFPVFRLKGDKLFLKLGNENCEIAIRDGLTDDAAQLVRVIQGRITEVLLKRHRAWIDEYKKRGS